MDHLQRFTSQVRSRLFLMLLGSNALLLLDWWVAEYVLQLTNWQMAAALLLAPLLSLTIFPWLSSTYIVQPTKLIWQAILHIAPDRTDADLNSNI